MTFKHPTMTAEQVLDLHLATGIPVKDILPRRTGRTTAIALRALGAAMGDPGITVTFVDHHGTASAHACACDTARKIVDARALTGFTFTRDTVTYLKGTL